MQRFADLLQRGLREAGHDVRVVRPAVIAQKLPVGNAGGKWLGYVDKFLLFPRSLRRLASWADIVHICDHSNSLYVRHVKERPHLVTCHDMLAIRSALGAIPDNPTGWTGRQLQRRILTGLTRARHVVCVSDATQSDLRRIARIQENRVSRIYVGLNYPYAPMERNEANAYLSKLGLAAAGPFILHVGGNQWYKNRLGLLRHFSTLRKHAETRHLKLLMVGKPWTPEMREFIRQAQLGQAVLEFTGTSEEELRALYSSAEVMLFPSLGEGFGWPVAEAQACGCPVVTTNRAPMTEVGGDAALYADPTDSDAVTAAVINALKNRSGLREKGLRNALRFSPMTMINAYTALYETLAVRG
jgi:glycosyltransferase involved in cell wall biosynthesis